MDDPQNIQEKTPLMGPEVRQRGAELSLRRLHPPLKVPGYEQEQFVGRGAFGEVWSAVNSNSGRRVAIKFYSRRGGLDWSNMAREVEKLRFLFTDRYVVQLLEVGWEADPPYFVMEYMQFGSLADLLHQGALPLGEVVRLFREIALGMVHAHGKFEPSVSRYWLCSAQPVFIARGHGKEYDSGWTILIQERAARYWPP